MKSPNTLTAKEIDEFVDAILKKDDPAKRSYDPVDDFDTLCRFATFALPGVRNLPGFVEVPPLQRLTGRYAPARECIRSVGLYLEAINPTVSAFDWGRIYHRILLRRNGVGVPVRIRKRPALAIREAARTLSFVQLQAKFPDKGRSILRRYQKEARDAIRKK